AAQGRAHLVVHRDAEGRTHLALAPPLFKDRWQNDVAVAAAGTAHAMLDEGRTLENAAALGRNAMAATSKIAEGALGAAPGRPPAGGGGCATCCHRAGGATPPEVSAISPPPAAPRAPAELAAAVRRIREADDRTRGLPAAERVSPDLPCPFLEDARCSIYE